MIFLVSEISKILSTFTVHTKKPQFLIPYTFLKNISCSSVLQYIVLLKEECSYKNAVWKSTKRILLLLVYINAYLDNFTRYGYTKKEHQCLKLAICLELVFNFKLYHSWQIGLAVDDVIKTFDIGP